MSLFSFEFDKSRSDNWFLLHFHSAFSMSLPSKRSLLSFDSITKKSGYCTHFSCVIDYLSHHESFEFIFHSKNLVLTVRFLKYKLFSLFFFKIFTFRYINYFNFWKLLLEMASWLAAISNFFVGSAYEWFASHFLR